MPLLPLLLPGDVVGFPMGRLLNPGEEEEAAEDDSAEDDKGG